VIRAPFDLTWPILVRDRHFDIARHVVRVAIPSPGTAEQCDLIVADFLSRPLSPSRPLWQLLVLEGSADGRASLVLKIHHALADGVSGAETFANLFDISQDVRDPAPCVDPVEEDSVNSSWGLLRYGLGRLLSRSGGVLGAFGRWVAGVMELTRSLGKVVSTHAPRSAAPPQPSIFEARRTSLNAAPGVEKLFCRAQLPLAEVKRAARARGVSVTDVVLSTTSGALRRLLDQRGEEFRKDLVAFVPINVRVEGDAAALGNQISAMLVRLHADVTDPEVRVREISRDAQATLVEQKRHRAQIFQDVPRVLGPTLLAAGARVVAALGLVNRVPAANVMISSVPGPPIPLWLSGHRVESAAPVGPLFGSLSLNITALGFEENLEFGFLGCAETMPDLALLRDFVLDEALALIAATPATPS